MITEFVERSKTYFRDAEENVMRALNDAKTSEKNGLNYFEKVDEKFVLAQLDALKKNEIQIKKNGGKLFGVAVSVKDCICVKGLESKAGSGILKGYVPLFNATAVQKAIDQGAIIIGKTTQDEFGFGTFATNTKKIPKNSLDTMRSCGGSSGGSAGFTAFTKAEHISIAESTGGSIACPASFCGVTGLTPTYGLVSRSGLIDYANSLDKIGTMSRNFRDSFLGLEVISGADEKDSTNSEKNYSQAKEKITKVGIIKELVDYSDEKVKKNFEKKILNGNLGEKTGENIQIEEISLPLNFKYALAVYYILATSEASTNLAKLSGLRYGVQKNPEGKHFDEYFSEIRTSEFGAEAKRRIILGTFARMSGYRDAYYLRALKARTLLIEEFKKAFGKYDVLVHPTMPVTAPKFSEIEKLSPMQCYAMDLCTVPSNLCGLPHLSVNPLNLDGKTKPDALDEKEMPFGIMAIANHFNENKLLAFAEALK